MTTMPTSLQVDLADPADIRAKLPEAEKILEAMEGAVRERVAERDRWRSLVGVLRGVAEATQAVSDGPETPQPPTTTQPSEPVTPPDGSGTTAGSDESSGPAESGDSGPGRTQMQEVVVAALNRAGGPTRSKDLRRMLALEGHDFPAESVSNALWYAAERLGTVRKVSRGVYAPLTDADADKTSANGSGTPFGTLGAKLISS